MDVMAQQIAEAQAEWEAEPNEPGKLAKLVDLLVKTEQPEQEARAIELLESAYENQRQYRYKLRVGQIRLAQFGRQERQLRQAIMQDPSDENLKREYQDFAKDRAEQEMAIYQEAADNYPTDSSLRYNVGIRMFL